MNSVFSSDDGAGRNMSVSDQSSSAFEGNGFFCGGLSGGPRAHPSFSNRGVATAAGATSDDKGGPLLWSLPLNINILGQVDPTSRNQHNRDGPTSCSTSNVKPTPEADRDMSDSVVCDADRLRRHSTTSILDGIDSADFSGEQDAVAEALNSLSCHERDRTFQDVHGVADLPFEDDETIQTALHEMKQSILAKISKANGDQSIDLTSNDSIIQQSILAILQQSKDSTSVPSSTPPFGSTLASPAFLIQFLRSEEFNVEAASSKFLRFMEEKLNLFGADKLLKDITLDDMDEEDMEALNSGIIQRVPHKDRSGRDVVVVVPSLFPLKASHKSLVRTFYYVLMSTIMSQMHSNDQCQSRRHGLVQIVHRLPKDFELDRKAMYKTQKLRQALPFWYASVHIFSDNPTVPLILGLFRRFLNIKTLIRIQMHCGTDIEVLYKLMSYGIPITHLPITQDGLNRADWHLSWVQERRRIESNVKVQERNLSNNKKMMMVIQAATVREDSDDMELDTSSESQTQQRSADDNLGSRGASTMSTLQSSSSSLSSASCALGVATTDPIADDSVVVATVRGDVDLCGDAITSTPSASMTAPASIKEPSSSDILLGRGRVIDTRPGNMEFRRFLAQQLERYDQAPKFQKTEIAEGLLRHLKDVCQVRFLKEIPDGKGFEEVDDKTAREKISRTFRRIRETKRGGGGSIGGM